MRGRRPAILQDGPDVLLWVQVRPRSSRNHVVVVGEQSGGPGPEGITVRLTAPPVEGAANAACQSFLATLLGVAKSRIAIVRGETSRQKLVRVQGADVTGVLARLRSAP
jgi:uncharacterized protein (TIGR00251 family)